MFTPFLPGDSLLFAAGTFAALGALELWRLWLLFFAAAIMGDSMNYWIGRKGGGWLVDKFNGRLIRRAHLEQAHRFYEKHGPRHGDSRAFRSDRSDLRALHLRHQPHVIRQIYYLRRARRLDVGFAFCLQRFFLRQHPGGQGKFLTGDSRDYYDFAPAHGYRDMARET